MPENNFELTNSKLLAGDELSNSTGDKLRREYELLRDGISGGVMHRVSSPEDLLLGAGTALGGGAAFRMMLDAGGRWGQAAKVAGTGLLLLAGADLTRRAVPTAGAMIDTWKSGANMDANKNIVANNLGTALVDYPVMMLAGNAGFRMAGRPATVTLDLTNYKFDPKLVENSLKIDPATRAAMSNPRVLEAAPAARADMIRSQSLKLPEGPVNLGGLKASAEIGIKAPAEFKVPPELLKLNQITKAPNIFESPIKTEFFNFKAIEVRPGFLPAYPVLPVDLMSKRELLQRVEQHELKLLEPAAIREMPKQNNEQINRVGTFLHMKELHELIRKPGKK